MFHRVLPPGEPSYDDNLVVSTTKFDEFLAWLEKYYDIVPLSGLLNKDARPGRGLCALTFDDGWSDNYQYALPILQKHGASGTFFLATGFIGTHRRLWQERLWYWLRSQPSDGHKLEQLTTAGKALPWCPNFTVADVSYARLRQLLLSCPSSDAEEFVDALVAGSADADPCERAFLSWDEVVSMRHASMEFGSHTVNHCLLTRADRQTAGDELARSRIEIEQRLGADVTAFAYPWGAVSERVRSQVQEAGYSIAVATAEAVVRQHNRDPLLIPRVFVSNSVLGNGKRFSSKRFLLHLARLSWQSPPAQHSRGPARVLFLIDMIYNWQGGSEQQLRKIVEHLNTNCFQAEVRVLRRSNHNSKQEFPDYVRPVCEADRYSGLEVFRAIYSALKQTRPDIVHTFFPDCNLYGTLAARAAGAPRVINSWRSVGTGVGPVRLKAMRLASKFADHLQCNSRTVQSWVANSLGAAAPRSGILPNALEVRRFTPPCGEQRQACRRQLNVPQEAPMIISVANLRPVKDIPTLLRAAAILKQQLPGATICILGEGGQLGALQTWARQLNVEDTVRFEGVQADIRPYLWAADLAVLTSQSEGSSNAVLEYMAAGVPSVLSDIPANRELVDGIFFRTGDADDLANKLIMLYHDANLRQAMKADYRSRAERYSYEAFARRLVGIYDSLIAYSVP